MTKVVLITGASSGIGKSIGTFLHDNGFIVYGTSRNPERVTNSTFPLLPLDVRNTETITITVQKIIQLSGRLDVVINNAGVGITGPIEEIPSEEIKNNFETNFFVIHNGVVYLQDKEYAIEKLQSLRKAGIMVGMKSYIINFDQDKKPTKNKITKKTKAIFNNQY